MPESGHEFNLELWNERFNNIRTGMEKIERKLGDLSKLMIAVIIGISGWALVQLYTQVSNQAEAHTIPIAAIHK